MKMYLAARYSRLAEMQEWRDDLHSMGHQVTSRWVNGAHQVDDQGKPIGSQGEATVEGDVDGSMDVTAEQEALRLKFLNDDLQDVASADMFVAFTEPARTDPTRGGRHVELGYALGINDFRSAVIEPAPGVRYSTIDPMHIVVVGPRENLFTWHPSIVHCPTMAGFVSLCRGLVLIERKYTLRRKTK